MTLNPARELWILNPVVGSLTLQVVVHIAPLEARMADIDGTVAVTRRRLPRGRAGRPGPAGREGARPGGAACGPLVHRDEPFEAERKLYFRAGETGVRWLTQVGCSDLL